MAYREIINLLDNSNNQSPKIKTKNWVEVNDDEFGAYTTSSKIKFKTKMLKSSLCAYSDASILL